MAVVAKVCSFHCVPDFVCLDAIKELKSHYQEESCLHVCHHDISLSVCNLVELMALKRFAVTFILWSICCSFVLVAIF